MGREGGGIMSERENTPDSLGVSSVYVYISVESPAFCEARCLGSECDPHTREWDPVVCNSVDAGARVYSQPLVIVFIFV